MGSEMDTFAARLATFDTVLKPEKRRSSTTKGSRLIGWPHQRPSPAELAHAGFYYKPYETNPDNTTCFQCNRALDGWEEEDNPITEHLKHSPDCGWAIIMDIQQQSSNPATIEDPTSERIAQARLATFGAAWPHDGKRGWTCQSGKMVEGGWYFCPNEESNDLASCPYCKLSLDGWEPKDEPFDEHYRRSSDCSFFVFAQPPTKKGKGSRSKKARTSKASSRLSTQSVATTASEAPDMDIDESMDQTIMSQTAVKAKSTKKTTKGKGKSAKSKKEEAEADTPMDVDEPELVQPEPSKPKRTGRGKKRVSEEMDYDEPETVVLEDHQRSRSPAGPPSKRRAPRARSSSNSHGYNYEQRDDAMTDAASVDEPPQEEPTKKGRKKKGAASKSRKGSDVSVASKPTSKSRLPRDSELDAALEADLEPDVPEVIEPEPEPAKPRASKKTKTTKKSKAPSKAVKDEEEDAPQLDVHEEQPDIVESHASEIAESEEPAETKTSKSSKRKGTKKTKNDDSHTEQTLMEETSNRKFIADDNDEIDHHDSFVSVEIVNRQPEPRPEAEKEPAEKPSKKKPSKKEPKKSKKTKKAEQTPPPEPARDERAFRSPSPSDDVFGTPNDISDEVEMVAAPQTTSPELQQTHQRTPPPPKTTKRFSDIPQEEHLAEALSESQRSHSSGRQYNHVAFESDERAVSPLPAAHHSTPSLSPQSSDAENRPPSSRPSSLRPPTSPEQKTRTPLAVSTPSPSKRNANAGFPPSAHPWTPVDIDEVLYGEASDKENTDLAGIFKEVKGHLTSPEKKMTVEQWIMWNAKNGEERLKRECERLVNQFEKEGSRAMQRLEAIECIE